MSFAAVQATGMRRGFRLILIMLAACSAVPAAAPAQLPAFPGAEGAGATSLGGRGGLAIHVTNLNDSGPGSLRQAIDAVGPRTIIFDIGGTIALKKPLAIRSGRVTIAGQTAPGGGITIRDHGLRIEADDVVVRFIRARLGDKGGLSEDAISVISGHRIILDHVSASWGTDETLSVAPNWRRGANLGDVTVQWSIISESLCGPAGKGPRHCYGSLVSVGQGGRISFHHNLWANHAGRMPRPANQLPPGRDPVGGRFQFASNVIYNWGAQQAGYDSGPASNVRSEFLDNSYWPGPDSRGSLIYENRNPFAKGWFSGNSYGGQQLPDTGSHVLSRTPGFLLSQPVAVAPLKRDPATSAYERVLTFAGDSLPRDSVDNRVVEGVRARSGSLIESQDQVGGWPALASGAPRRDSDGDGIPDEWEARNGLNPRNSADGARVRSDGYTNLEYWLNALAAPAIAG